MTNGEVVTVNGAGEGSIDRGSLGINLEFSSIPSGFSIYCAALWTACCSTPTFAIEQDGGVNMLTLSGGRYRCNRRFDFGKFGYYDYNYEIRLDPAADTMKATGVIQGSLNLPDLVGVESSFTEIMVPIGGQLVRSFSSTTFQTAIGESIPVTVEGRYEPLVEDDADWTCCAMNQIRKSFINVLEAEGTKLSLTYSTVINGIHAPEPLPEFQLAP
ncbi:MAG: hypothetical protein ACRDRK_17200 [Pseudonocardia sp.]